MSRNPSREDPEEWAALYLAGALDDADREAFEASPEAGAEEVTRAIARLSPVADALARAIPEVPPTPEARRELMERLACEGTPPPPAGRLLVRASAEGWSPTPVPGISVRILRPRDRAGRMAGLVRLAPGAALPPHRHTLDEEIFLIEGDYQEEGRRFGPGDYLYSPAGSDHAEGRSKSGCVALVIASFAVLAPG